MYLRKTLITAAAGLAAMALASGAQAASAIKGLYNTGVGADYTSVTGNPVDQHWTLSGGTAFASIVPGFAPADSWLKDDASSRWIGPSAFAGDDQPAGNYEYVLRFDLTAIEAAGASFFGRFAADNSVSAITLNGFTLASGELGNFDAWTSFSAGASSFLAGTNELRFSVFNRPNDAVNPTGLRVEFQDSTVGTPTAPVPEPATWALMISGFGGAGMVLRRRRLVQA